MPDQSDPTPGSAAHCTYSVLVDGRVDGDKHVCALPGYNGEGTGDLSPRRQHRRQVQRLSAALCVVVQQHGRQRLQRRLGLGTAVVLASGAPQGASVPAREGRPMMTPPDTAARSATCCDIITGNCWARENCYRREVLTAISAKAEADPYWTAIYDQHLAELRDIEARFTDA